MSFIFHKIASSRADATALVAEDKHLPGQVKNFLRDLIMSRAEGALEVEADGHVEGDYFHMGRVIVKGMAFDVPSPVAPAPVVVAPPLVTETINSSTVVPGVVEGDGLTISAPAVPTPVPDPVVVAAPVVEAPVVTPAPVVVPAPLVTSPAPAAPLTAAPAATDPMGGAVVAISENPADHA